MPMMITMPRPRALPTLVCPAITLPLRNEPIWIERQRDRAGGQRLGRRVGRHGAAEQQQHAAQERRHQHRAADVAPVLPAARAQVLRGLPPGRPQPLQRGQDDEHHERDLEVHVDQDDAGQRVQAEAVVVDVQPEVVQPAGEQPAGAERGHEQEGQRDPAEVGEHAGDGDDDLAQDGRAGGEDRVGDDQAEDPGDHRRQHRQQQRLLESREVDAVDGDVEVAEGERAGGGVTGTRRSRWRSSGWPGRPRRRRRRAARPRNDGPRGRRRAAVLPPGAGGRGRGEPGAWNRPRGRDRAGLGHVSARDGRPLLGNDGRGRAQLGGGG